MIHLTPEQEEELFTEFAPLDEQKRINDALAPKTQTLPYEMASQHCLKCNAEIPFVPFKDSICDECCGPAF
jgi:hypothetical protein